jgi:hypothetical protein
MATFGTTAEGTGTSSSWADAPFALLAALGEDGLVSKISARLANSAGGACNCKAAIYSNNAGEPNALQAVSSAVSIPGSSSLAWYDFTFASPPSLATASWWLAILPDEDAGGLGIARFDFGTGTSAYWGDDYTDGPLETVTTHTNWTRNLSIYATYSLPGGIPRAALLGVG